MKIILAQISLLVILTGIGFSNLSYGQDAQTSNGVNIDGTWYLGEGLKKGDYFEYSLCEINLNDCIIEVLTIGIGLFPFSVDLAKYALAPFDDLINELTS